MEEKRILKLEKSILNSFIFLFLFFSFIPFNSASIFSNIFGSGTLDYNTMQSNNIISYRFNTPYPLSSPFKILNSAGSPTSTDGLLLTANQSSFYLSVPIGNQDNYSADRDGYSFDFYADIRRGDPSLEHPILDTRMKGFNITNTFSGSFMINDNEISSDPMLMHYTTSNGQASTIGFFFWVDNSVNGYKLEFLLSTSIGTHQLGVSSVQAVPNRTSPSEIWTQVGFTYDGSERASGLKLYINGKSVPFDIYANTLQGGNESITNMGNIFIGSNGNTSGSLSLTSLRVDDVLIFDKVINEQKMKQLYGNGRAYTHNPSPIAFFQDEYKIGAVKTGTDLNGNPSNLKTAVKGYTRIINSYEKEFQLANLNYFDPAFNSFQGGTLTKGQDNEIATSGDIYTAFNSTAIHMNLTFINAPELGDQVHSSYFDSFYLSFANPYGFDQQSFNVNITPFEIPPQIIQNFSKSYNLDLYDTFNGTANLSSFVLKMNNFFTGHRTLMPYNYINVTYGNQTISIPHNSTFQQVCNEQLTIVLCYYNYPALNLNDVWLVFYRTGDKIAYKVNVSAGNSFGFANQSFGVTSGGAVFTGELSSNGGNLDSIVNLASFFNQLFPDASTLSTLLKMTYVILSLLLITSIGVILFKSELGIILALIFDILIFVYYLLIHYISVGSLIVLILIAMIGIGAKLWSGNK